MNGEILINITPQETRVAIVVNGVLQEVFVERATRRGLVGNIYQGRVCRVLPGMEAAFIEAGLARTAFLHVSDVAGSHGESDDEQGDGSDEATKKNGDNGRGVGRNAPTESIAKLLHEGQELRVQVVKDPIGSKGARLTSRISFPSRYLVFMPEMNNVGVSQRIEDEDERQRLRDLVQQCMDHEGQGGYIVRTAAEGASADALRADMRFLQKLWASILERGRNATAGTLIHEDLQLALRALRDLVGADIEKIRIDSRETYQKACEFAAAFIPEIVERIEYYPGERPIFDIYSVEDEIQKALERKVQLKSGGYLIIDQTEAMTTIDVNTGAYVGHWNLEETIFKTNLEAAQAIARQLRLRNLGGIIILDFIDMIDEEHKRQVLRALETHLERSGTKSNLSEVSALGLVQMTRKRTRESLGHVLCEPCPTCSGKGTLKTAETVCYEVFREILRAARQFEARKFLVLASQEVVDLLLDEEATSLAELETFIGKPIRFQVEQLYTQEQYDVVLM